MFEDNVYKRQSVPQIVPPEQEEQADKEQVSVLEQYGLIKDAIDRLKLDVDFYEKNQGISDEVLLNPEEFMHTVAGNKKAVASIQREIGILEDLVSEHVER